jgi:ABC-type glycerol-3-phosphate transport system permease component
VEVFFYALMTLLALMFMAPLIWMITASLKPENQVMAIPPTFLPRHFQWENYTEAWGSIQGFLFNSVKLAVLSVGGTLFVSSLAAYAFARINFAGRNLAFAMLLSTIMVPGFVTLIPLYIIYRQIGWIDTHEPLWVPRVLHYVFGIFLLRQFFMQNPQEPRTPPASTAPAPSRSTGGSCCPRSYRRWRRSASSPSSTPGTTCSARSSS